MDIGIDFGTSNCKVAIKGRVAMIPGYPAGEYLAEFDVTILPSATGNLTIPSVFWWHPDQPDGYMFGNEAKQKAEGGGIPIMAWMRSMGTTMQLMLKGRVFTAQEIATHFLRYLKQCAETATGQTVNRVVITHPVYFSPTARNAMIKAAQSAGLGVTPERMLMNPAAAALAYMLNDGRDPLRVMIYDLGGGTFDVAVMEKRGGIIQMQKFNGDLLLGGHTFDNALVQWILEQLKAKGIVILYDENIEEHRARRARMLQVAEVVKIRLSEQRVDSIAVPVQVDLIVDDKGSQVQFVGQINREQYTALIQEDLQKTIQCCRSALDGAGMKAEDLHAILLVGGSTRGKWVVDAVTKAFGNMAINSYYPDYCVAAGAAIAMAQYAPGPTQNDRISLALDYSPTSVLPTVCISGSICPSPGSDLTPEACRNLQVHLEMSDDVLSRSAGINVEGHFIFKNIDLREDGDPLRFKVGVSENGQEVLYTEGEIVYKDVRVDPIPPSLPCSLFLKSDRLVPIVTEGALLPAKCQVRLRRAFSGSSLEIPVFTENEQVGTLFVEDIPDVAGEGCLIVVDMEVTQYNEIRGQVLVYAPDGKTVAKEGPVRLMFPIPRIPELSELLGRFDELNGRLETEILHASAQDRLRLDGHGKTLVRKIKRMTEEQALDRNVLFEAIKELGRIVNLPPDDMDPPRRNFENLLAECREEIASPPNNPRFRAYGPQLDRIETEARDALLTKNIKKWMAANDILQKISERISGILY